MQHRVTMVTGATGTIGQAIVRSIAATPGADVVLVARNELRAHELATSIGSAARIEVCDLSREADVHALAQRWQGPLHVLVNNAATAPPQRTETPEGIELQLATNVLGYLWMARAFAPRMEPGGRIVNVASYWAGDLDVDDLEFTFRDYDNDTAYRQSKQADRMLTAALADRLKDRDITVNACHPGDVDSTLSRDLGYGGHESPDTGADTPAWLATSPDVQGRTGGYYARRRREADRFMADRKEVETLYKMCEDYCQLT